MAFVKYDSTVTVTAEELTEDRNVITSDGIVIGHTGDWEVRYPDGRTKVEPGDRFRALWKLSQVVDNDDDNDDDECENDPCEHSHHHCCHHPHKKPRPEHPEHPSKPEKTLTRETVRGKK